MQQALQAHVLTISGAVATPTSLGTSSGSVATFFVPTPV